MKYNHLEELLKYSKDITEEDLFAHRYSKRNLDDIFFLVENEIKKLKELKVIKKDIKKEDMRNVFEELQEEEIFEMDFRDLVKKVDDAITKTLV